jgi:cellulose synthase/poly-beta-1,6-N-acetylglucosamine synthase-like glycosyltransferase
LVEALRRLQLYGGSFKRHLKFIGITMFARDENVKNYFSELAKQHSLKFLFLPSLQINLTLLKKTDSPDYMRLQAIPLAETETTITIATSNPTTQNIAMIHEFWKETDKKIELVIMSRQDITQTLANQFKQEYLHDITHCRDDLDPVHSASYTFSLMEKIVLIALLAALMVAAFNNFFATASWVCVFLATGTTIIMAYKMGLSIHSLRFLLKIPPEKFNLDDNDLPLYTILIPLLREKEETIKVLLKSLDQFDYPKELLDVKFLLEEDDIQTLETLDKFELPWYYQVLIVPPGMPRSKPRACNYGMQFAFGKFLAIYDAEDIPDPNQLKLVLQRFHDCAENVDCVQAALNFYNAKENLITRLFTIEYTYWFDYLIPALASLRAPVPLGGTSNHFKIEVLRKLGGWDPFIGTEDAEIGVRLYRHGYRVEASHSTTYEEANTKLVNWFKQRTRWNKGYMQTYLVNMRDPINMIKQIGPWRFVNFQLFVGGNVFIQLANLPLWLFLLWSFFMGNSYFTSYFPTLLLYITWYNFLVSNLILLVCQFIATYNRGYYALLPYVPLKIFYWLVMSLAGYVAIVELLVRPGYWYKTEHGLSKNSNDQQVNLHDKS